jgi:hypothetical protein
VERHHQALPRAAVLPRSLAGGSPRPNPTPRPARRRGQRVAGAARAVTQAFAVRRFGRAVAHAEDDRS